MYTSHNFPYKQSCILSCFHYYIHSQWFLRQINTFLVAFHDNLLPGRGTSHLLLNIIDTSFQRGTSLKSTLWRIYHTAATHKIIKIILKLCFLVYLTVKSAGNATSCWLTVRTAKNIGWLHFHNVQWHIECLSNNLCNLNKNVKNYSSKNIPCAHWTCTFRVLHVQWYCSCWRSALQRLSLKCHCNTDNNSVAVIVQHLSLLIRPIWWQGYHYHRS